MHTLIKKTGWAVLAIGLAVSMAHLTAAAAAPEEQYPYIIRVETWAAREGFRSGDQITIHLVRGDRPKIEPGGTYWVQGSYALRSAPEATLALSLTASSAANGRSAWSPSQRTKITSGDGTFSFVATMQSEGEYHVSFYFPDPRDPRRSSSGGGIYFGNR